MQHYVDDLLYKGECYKIIGLCMKIHSVLGRGFKEIVYKDAMEVEFLRNQVIHEREKQFRIIYDGIELKRKFNADFIVYDKIILEIKAQSIMPTDAFRQTLNYLKASEIELGIMINFGENRLNFQRVVCSR
ncbi:MAG: GxxExxY protein [Bacteroidota bacterium]